MIPDFMALAGHPFQKCSVFRNVRLVRRIVKLLADHKERRFCAALLQTVQETARLYGIGTVVKRKSDHRRLAILRLHCERNQKQHQYNEPDYKYDFQQIYFSHKNNSSHFGFVSCDGVIICIFSKRTLLIITKIYFVRIRAMSPGPISIRAVSSGANLPVSMSSLSASPSKGIAKTAGFSVFLFAIAVYPPSNVPIVS